MGLAGSWTGAAEADRATGAGEGRVLEPVLKVVFVSCRVVQSSDALVTV